MAVRLADHLGIPHISTGDIFRYNIKNETDLGKQVKAILDSGELVPDELTIDLVKDRLQHDDTKKGFILDGFPRTIPQAEALSEFTELDAAINFSLSDEEIIKRLSGRRVHPGSGRTYHVIFNPPKVEGKDDVTGEDLVIRPDDEVDAIRNRLQVYKRQTQPLIEFYEKRDLLTTIDASPKPDEVFQELTSVIDKLRS